MPAVATQHNHKLRGFVTVNGGINRVIQFVIVFQEFLRSTVDLADLVGLHLVMTKVAGKGELKVLVAGVGRLQLY